MPNLLLLWPRLLLGIMALTSCKSTPSTPPPTRDAAKSHTSTVATLAQQLPDAWVSNKVQAKAVWQDFVKGVRSWPSQGPTVDEVVSALAVFGPFEQVGKGIPGLSLAGRPQGPIIGLAVDFQDTETPGAVSFLQAKLVMAKTMDNSLDHLFEEVAIVLRKDLGKPLYAKKDAVAKTRQAAYRLVKGKEISVAIVPSQSADGTETRVIEISAYAPQGEAE